MQNIFKNWNFVRILRLATGIFLVVEAVKSGMWFLVLVQPLVLLLLAIWKWIRYMQP